MIIVLIILVSIVVIIGVSAFMGAPYVPSHRKELQEAFRVLRPLSKQDVLVDLGSGDGVVLLEARHAGAGKVIGFEIHPLLVLVSTLRLRRTTHHELRMTNMWRAAAPQHTTVVYVFTVGRDVARLEQLLQRWASQVGRRLDVIVYGHELPSLPLQATHRAHRLYRVMPLQQQKAKV